MSRRPEQTVVKIGDLQPNPKNPRRISKTQKEMLDRSLKEFGDLGGIVFNRKTKQLVGGHQRIEALKADKDASITITEQLKEPDRTGTVALGFVSSGNTRFAYREVEWTKKKEAAANIAANQHGGEFDSNGVAEILESLGTDYDFGLTGFDPTEVKRYLALGSSNEGEAEAKVELCDELQKEWKVELGQVWEIGRHRLICGDSTKADVVAKLLQHEIPELMITDPPYGVEYDASWRNNIVNAKGKRLGATQNLAIGKVLNDDRADWTETWRLFPGDVAYVWHADRNAAEVQRSIEAAEFDIRSQIVWAKQQFAIGRGDYHWQHEPCWYAVRKGKPSHYIGGRSQTTLWEIDKPQKSETGHSTQKPIECIARPIRNHVGNVYEPFAGSGTTMVAAENLGRTCYAVELHPPYCAVILDRMKTAFPGIEIKRI